MGGCGPSGCGRLGALILLSIPKSDNASRTGCVESRPFNSTNRARQFSFPLRHWCLLGSSCEYYYVWIDRSDRGNSAAEATSRTIKSILPGCTCGVDQPTPANCRNIAWVLKNSVFAPNGQIFGDGKCLRSERIAYKAS